MVRYVQHRQHTFSLMPGQILSIASAHAFEMLVALWNFTSAILLSKKYRSDCSETLVPAHIRFGEFKARKCS